MPRTSTPSWVLTAELLIGFPVLCAAHATDRIAPHAEGWDRLDGALAFVFSLWIVLFGMSAVLLPAWYCLRNYNPYTRLLAWRNDRPVRSALATGVFGGLALMATSAALAAPLLHQPWYWSVYALLWAFWFLALRAATIDALSDS